MGLLGLLLLLVVVLGLIGFALTERRIWEGLASAFTVSVEKGGHGEVVRTAEGPAKGETALSRRLARSLGVAVLITAVLTVLSFFAPPFSLAGMLAPSLDGILVIAALTALGQEEGNAWRSFGWALGGYVVVDALVTALAMAVGLQGAALLNALGMWAGTLGCGLAVALFVSQRTFVRQFQDGTKSAVRVGAFSPAARALARKADPTFAVSGEDLRSAISSDFLEVKPKGRDK
ncbi:MAG: hypothetical protein HFJ66_08505 [Eggerthellaceae bacterium]|nr:hypothetical protein [Eggerthellaceae bacterium]